MTEDELSYIDVMPTTVRQRRPKEMADGFRNASNCVVYPIQPSVAGLTDDQVKYDVFCQWLKMCQSRESLPASEGFEFSPRSAAESEQEIELSITTEQSQLIRHSSEEDDEFVDTESNMESLPPVSTIIEDLNPHLENLLETMPSDDSDENNLDMDMKLIIPKLLNISPGSSSSDMTALSDTPTDASNRSSRPVATHKKGRAPPVPTLKLQTPTSSTIDPSEAADNLSKSVYEDNPPQRHRSSDQKENKKKKNFFSYLPGILKPLSPSSSSHTVAIDRLDDNEHKDQHETLI